MTDIADSDDTATHLAAIRRFYGSAPRMSDWFAVTQDMINQFCAAPGDSDWMHVDPASDVNDPPTPAQRRWARDVLQPAASVETAYATAFPAYRDFPQQALN
jgi:hypothetical protein